MAVFPRSLHPSRLLIATTAYPLCATPFHSLPISPSPLSSLPITSSSPILSIRIVNFRHFSEWGAQGKRIMVLTLIRSLKESRIGHRRS
ncbi:hypothetical protein SDJN03_09083, partial [Cucurbita argyrosperma subsp. sororia]